MFERQLIGQPLAAWAGLHHAQPAIFTCLALAGVDLGHSGHEVLRVFLGNGVGRWHVQGGFGQGQLRSVGAGQQPVVANAFEPAGQDVLHEAPNERWPRQAQRALFALLAQELLGHSDVSTTMIDTHMLKVAARGTASPLDAMALEPQWAALRNVSGCQ
jgi:hypothetical protein